MALIKVMRRGVVVCIGKGLARTILSSYSPDLSGVQRPTFPSLTQAVFIEGYLVL